MTFYRLSHNCYSMKDLAKIRSDVVGSLLRPAHLKEARLAFDEGKISPDEMRRIEDQAIRQAVLLQETVGLDVVTDGEFRRLNFQDSFGESVAGFDAARGLTMGLGLRNAKWSLDYAVLPSGELGRSHRFSLGARW